MFSKKILMCFLLLNSFVLSAESEKSSPEVTTVENGKPDEATESLPEVKNSPEGNSTEGTNVKIKLNETEEIEFEIKPGTISRDELVRIRKIFSRKGIVSKNGDSESGDVSGNAAIEKYRGSSDAVGMYKIKFAGEGGEKRFPERLSEVTAEDILPLLPRNLTGFFPHIDELKNEKCRKEAKHFFLKLHDLTKWAVQMFDASTKIPEGILYGSSHNLGNFDECVNVKVDVSSGEKIDGEEIIQGKYCLAKVSLSGFQKKHDETDESYYPLHSAWKTLRAPTTRREFRKDVVRWAFCVPSACTSEDVENFLNSVAEILSIRGLQLKFQVSPDMCQIKREFEFDKYDIALSIVVAAFVLVITVATAYDVMSVKKSSDKPKSLKATVLTCFSAYTNFVKLSAYTPSTHNLDSIFGIKAITMVLILMGHASAFIIGGPSMNSDFKEEAVLKIENGILLNNPLLVDTFLMIGAFLLCRLLLAELEKRKFVNPLIVYIARIIRLSPAYAVVIAIYCTWFYKFDSGPLWESRVGLERERCRKSWWANLLYINNYVGNEHLCMFQSWYLAVDSQFFFLAPAIIYPLYKWPVIGEIILFGATIISVIIPFVVTYVNHLDPVLMMYASEITDLSSNPMYKTTYIKTHMRGMSYTIGLLLGYVIHKIQSSGHKVSRRVLWSGWIVGTLFAISSMFTVSVFYYRPYDAFQSAVYASLHRVGWCLGIAWVIFACTTNNAVNLNKFLSHRVWVPFSRLSYCAYLVNGLVELHTIGSLRHTRYLANVDMAKEIMSHVFMTYCLALLFSILFEAPILAIESLLLKKSNDSAGKKPTGSNAVESNESHSSTESTNTTSVA